MNKSFMVIVLVVMILISIIILSPLFLDIKLNDTEDENKDDIPKPGKIVINSYPHPRLPVTCNVSIFFYKYDIKVNANAYNPSSGNESVQIEKYYNRTIGDIIWNSFMRGILDGKGYFNQGRTVAICDCSPEIDISMIDAHGNLMAYGHFNSHKIVTTVDNEESYVSIRNYLQEGYDNLTMICDNLRIELRNYRI